jgi:hypothetical protein
MAKILLQTRPVRQPRASLRNPIAASPRIARGDAAGGFQTERHECSRTRKLLQCRLAWYGLQAISLGSLRDVSERTASVDLFRNDGIFLGRVEVDRESGRVDGSAGRTLTHLLKAAG